MSFKDIAETFLFAGFATIVIGFFILAILVMPNGLGGVAHSILSKYDRKILLDDFKNPKIFLGGPLGLLKWLLIVGIGSLATGGLLYAINWIIF